MKDDECSWALLTTLIGPAISISLNFFKYASEEKNFYGIFMMIAYHLNFFAQGIVYKMWGDKIK